MSAGGLSYTTRGDRGCFCGVQFDASIYEPLVLQNTSLTEVAGASHLFCVWLVICFFHLLLLVQPKGNPYSLSWPSSSCQTKTPIVFICHGRNRDNQCTTLASKHVIMLTIFVPFELLDFKAWAALDETLAYFAFTTIGWCRVVGIWAIHQFGSFRQTSCIGDVSLFCLGL